MENYSSINGTYKLGKIHKKERGVLSDLHIHVLTDEHPLTEVGHL